MRATLYENVTQQIITAVEAGTGTYRMPWHSHGSTGMPVNAVSRRAYRGINTLLLWAAATRASYASNEWATYRQWTQRGCHVRKGERSTVILLWKFDECFDEESERRASRRLVARAFRVFNAVQVDGYSPDCTPLSARRRIGSAEAFFAAMPALIWSDSDSAFFDPASDLISMPPFSAFVSPEAYYSVLAHELTHWTGVPSRLNRDLSGRFGSEAYAMEELVAELGAAFIAGHLGLASKPRDDHAVYIRSWLAVLRHEPRAIFTAASRAQAAADFLIGLVEPTAASENIPATTAKELENAA